MGFKPKSAGEKTNNDYEQLVIDADTMLIQAAITQQENYVIVTHKKSGKEKEFKTKTQFHGRTKARDGGWLAETNEERESKGLEPFSVDDFEIDQKVRLIGSTDGGVMKFNIDLNALLRKTGMRRNFLIGFGGKGNFRDDYAQITKYKGDRPDKPILYKEIREELEYRYRGKLLIRDGIETDDAVSILGWENYQNHRKTGEWKYLLAYVDKDLKMIIGPYFNYMKPELGIMEIKPREAAENFCTQLLTGDSTDCIVGLPNLTDEIREEYGLRKANGIGAASIEPLLAGKSVKDMFKTVVKCYKAWYGEEPFEFESWRGDKTERTWVDMLQENARLLWMMRTDDDVYDIRETLARLEIDYE